ncbi:MAG: hypothetical protein R3F59_35660 [Myxococcota bacterium]
MRIRAWSITLGVVVGALSAAAVGAWAAGEADPAPLLRLKCRTFPTDIGAEVDTRDPQSAVGQWVTGLEDQGWEVANVQWDVGQKATGFPQGYTQVCLVPVR